jgi:hypothetical protein
MKTLYRNILNLILFSIFSVSAFAQNTKSLLWSVSGKGMKEPSYLFGTIHLICPQDYVWTDAMKQSLNKSKEVCFEMDMDDPNIMLQIASGMIDHSGKKLKDYFSPADYEKLEKYVKDSLGMSIELFQQMKPVALQTIFSTQSSDCSNPVSYENNIMETAKTANKEITGLETVSEQLDLFDNLPVDSVIKDIVDLLNGKNTDKGDFKKLTTAYKNQDLPALGKLIKESGATDKDIDGFLDVRNEKWIPRMIEKMDKTSVFFAVGAGHLYGDNGLISLLKKEGYTVTPIK